MLQAMASMRVSTKDACWITCLDLCCPIGYSQPGNYSNESIKAPDILQKWNCEGIVFLVRQRCHIPNCRWKRWHIEAHIGTYQVIKKSICFFWRVACHCLNDSVNKTRIPKSRCTMILKPLICFRELSVFSLVWELDGLESSLVVK